jgi:hypothetical protein
MSINTLLEEVMSKLSKKCPVGKDFNSPLLVVTIECQLMREIKRTFTEYQHYSVEEYVEEDFLQNLVYEVESILLLKMPLYDEQFHNRFYSKIEILLIDYFAKLAPIYVDCLKLEIYSFLTPVISQVIGNYCVDYK